MKKTAGVLLVLLLVTIGCRSSNVNSGDNASGSGNVNPSKDAAGSGNQATSRKGDFSTPRATAETFLTAANEHDAELLSRCMAAEVKTVKSINVKLRDKTLSSQELDGLGQGFKDAQIVGQKTDEQAGRAAISIRFSNGSTDELEMKKTADGWKIHDVG